VSDRGSRAGLPITREELLERFTKMITDGEIPPGDRLPSERRLAEQYAVSRPVIREVLQRLGERGLIHIAAGSGAYVREPSALDWARPLDALTRQAPATTRDVVEARAMLELRAAELASHRATAEEIADLERVLEAFDQAENVVERARYDIAFHSLVAKSSHNPVLQMMFGAIAPLAFEVMLRSLDDPNVVALGVPLHRNILDAIRAHDSTTAGAEAHAHVMLAETTFGDDYDALVDSVARRKVTSLVGPGAELEDIVSWALDWRR
jgi:GntR family transcriptional regulator, transcriptional repressor for pyruvate dehydrogenase complex